jgi:FMN-dependent NADH-azoreductase
MNILILNGNKDLQTTVLDGYLQRYQLKLHHLGHYVKTYTLNNLNFSASEADYNALNYTDDFRYIVSSLKEADLVVMATPLSKGHMSPAMTNIQARIINHYQNAVPSEAVTGHNYAHVERMPVFGFIYMPESENSQHELLLSQLSQENIATNLRSLLSFFIGVHVPLTEAIGITVSKYDYQNVIENASLKVPFGNFYN